MKPIDTDEVYRSLPEDQIPWHMAKPPKHQ
jgi:hypothetical protein